LKKYDIHWRNIELLRQFVTRFGNIKSRYVNSLSSSNQRRVEEAIKTARHMHAMPHYGETPAPLKKSITSIED
jgi:ribosomal protein S18